MFSREGKWLDGPLSGEHFPDPQREGPGGWFCPTDADAPISWAPPQPSQQPDTQNQGPGFLTFAGGTQNWPSLFGGSCLNGAEEEKGDTEVATN